MIYLFVSKTLRSLWEKGGFSRGAEIHRAGGCFFYRIPDDDLPVGRAVVRLLAYGNVIGGVRTGDKRNGIFSLVLLLRGSREEE